MITTSHTNTAPVNSTMKALGKLKPEKGIWMYDAPVPECGDNDILIKIRQTAICGTDIHIYHWDDWSQKTVPIPLTTGHEFVGEIVGLGKYVTEFTLGQRVSAEGHLTCNVCRACRTGRQHVCHKTRGVGVNHTGVFSEFAVIPQSNVIPIAHDISDDLACILDPLGNAVHTALSFDINGEDVLITGAGPIGCMAVAVARHAGARHVVVTDINHDRLALAQSMGATKVVNVAQDHDWHAIQAELGMLEGFDVALEMSGVPSAIDAVIDLTVPAGKIALLGIPSNPNFTIDWNKVIFKGLTVKGIYGREMYQTWYKMLFMLQGGMKAPIARVITHKFKVQDYEQAFATMASGHCGKVILDWT